MSAILEHLRAGRTGKRYPWRTQGSAMPLEVEMSSSHRANIDDFMDEWEMTLTAKTRFKCRDKDKSHAFRNAEKMLLQTIHKGMLDRIVLLRTAVYECDVEGAMNLLDEMQKEMGL